MIIFDADDPLVLNGTYDTEGYKPGEKARIAKAKARQLLLDQRAAEKQATAESSEQAESGAVRE